MSVDNRGKELGRLAGRNSSLLLVWSRLPRIWKETVEHWKKRSHSLDGTIKLNVRGKNVQRCYLSLLEVKKRQIASWLYLHFLMTTQTSSQESGSACSNQGEGNWSTEFDDKILALVTSYAWPSGEPRQSKQRAVCLLIYNHLWASQTLNTTYVGLRGAMSSAGKVSACS